MQSPAHPARTLPTLLFSVFVTVTGVGVVVPLLPIYAHDLGASGLYIGLIFGAFSLSRTVFLPIFGRLSDRRGRKRFIVAGLLLYALISLAYIFSSGVKSLIFIRLFHGVASAMLMPVIQAYVGDITPVGREGRMMGLFSMFVLFGLSIGPIIGGAVKDTLGLRFSFATMGALAFVGFLMAAILLPTGSEEQGFKARGNPVPWGVLIKDRTLASLCTFRFAYVVGIGVIWGFLPLYADIKLGTSSSSVGFLITLGVLVSGALNGPMGIVADRYSKRVLVTTGGAVAALAVLSLSWTHTYAQMAIATTFFGVGGGTCMPALMAIAARRGNDSESMGSVMALMTIAHSLGMLMGGLAGGVFMDVFELRFAFPAGAGVLAIGTIVFAVGTRHIRPIVRTEPPAVEAVDAATQYR